MPELMQRKDKSTTISIENEPAEQIKTNWENLEREYTEAKEFNEIEYAEISNEIKIVNQSETAMLNMEIQSNFSVLNSLEVWIANTGATVHNTPHLQGISNIKKPTNSN